MGILNVTPDSFSDGGRYASTEGAIQRALAMIDAGASVIDIGGESTRPGAADVGEQEELDRVIPVIESLRHETDVPISVDTSKPVVMQSAVDAGADMINDVRALQNKGALDMVASLDVVVCLMHMQGAPRTMQKKPAYKDVTCTVGEFLVERRQACENAGIARDRIVFDPGFGFGKSNAHNIELLANLRQLRDLGQPILVGLSRKATLGALTGRDTDDRVAAGVAAATLAVMNGALIVRAHDVSATVDALKVCQAVINSGS
ncbi:MAG: dihydropteroate synthase [Woeseiaceae bacterium]|nr:dihydropteroate synthase [Woeseiaceae bacterium]